MFGHLLGKKYPRKYNIMTDFYNHYTDDELDYEYDSVETWHIIHMMVFLKILLSV
jgi:hypothetical protein